jgi:hypothetical protein
MIGDDWKGMKEKVTGMPALKKKKKEQEKEKVGLVCETPFRTAFCFLGLTNNLTHKTLKNTFILV